MHACDKKDGSWKICNVHVHVQILNTSVIHSLLKFSWNSFIYRAQGEVSIYYRGGLKEE